MTATKNKLICLITMITMLVSYAIPFGGIAYAAIAEVGTKTDWTFDNLIDTRFTEETDIGGLTILAAASKYVACSACDEEFEGSIYTSEIKLSGVVGKDDEGLYPVTRAIAFTPTTAGRVHVIARHPASGSARTLAIQQGESSNTFDIEKGSTIMASYDVVAGETVYIYSTRSALNVLWVNFTDAASVTETPVTEKPLTGAEKVVYEDAATLKLGNISQYAAYFDFQLPKYGQNASDITWTSSNTDYIDIQTVSSIANCYTAVVTRPETDEECDETGGVSVTLTATIKYGSAEATKDFVVSVRKQNPLYYNDFQADVGMEPEGDYLAIEDNVASVTGESFRGIRLSALKYSRCFENWGHNDIDVEEYFDKRIMSTDEEYGKPSRNPADEENFAFYYNEYDAYEGATTYNAMWVKLIDPETGTYPEGIVMMNMDIYVITGQQKFNLGFGTSKPSQMCRFCLNNGSSTSLGYSAAGSLRVFNAESDVDYLGGTSAYRHPVGKWVRATLVANSDTHLWDFYYEGMQIATGLKFRNAMDSIPTIEFTPDRSYEEGAYLIDNIYVENITEDYNNIYWDNFGVDKLTYDEELGAYPVDKTFLLQYSGTEGVTGTYFNWYSSDEDVLSIETKSIDIDELVNYGYTEVDIEGYREQGLNNTTIIEATPGDVSEDTYVELEAVLDMGSEIKRKTFTLLVKASASEPTDPSATETPVNKAEEDLEALDFADEQLITANQQLDLPEEGELYSSEITWESSDSDIISDSGRVTRPTGSKNIKVTLTATAVIGEDTASREFTVWVKPKSSQGGGGGGGGGGAVVSVPSVTATPEPTQEPQVTEPPVEEEISFNDISSVAWANEAILTLAASRVINGYGDGKFGPVDNVTREQFVVMLVKALGLTAETVDTIDFTDVEDGAWYEESVNVAAALGIVNGYPDGSFGVGEPILRQDIAVMCVKALEATDKNLTEEISDFADYEEISDYAKAYVGKMGAAGYLNGDAERRVSPKNTATRAETAVILHNMIK